MNSFISQMPRSYCADDQHSWPDHLQSVMFAYRASPNTTSTAVSPFQLMTGQVMRLPIDTLLTGKEPSVLSPDAGVVREKSLEVMQAVARENKLRSQEKYKAHYDIKADWPSYKVGDQVLLFSPMSPVGHTKKLVIKYSGPFYITRVALGHTFATADVVNNKPHPHLVHANRLKPYSDPQDCHLLTKYPASQDDDIMLTPGKLVSNRATLTTLVPSESCGVEPLNVHGNETFHGNQSRLMPPSVVGSDTRAAADGVLLQYEDSMIAPANTGSPESG